MDADHAQYKWLASTARSMLFEVEPRLDSKEDSHADRTPRTRPSTPKTPEYQTPDYPGKHGAASMENRGDDDESPGTNVPANPGSGSADMECPCGQRLKPRRLWAGAML